MPYVVRNPAAAVRSTPSGRRKAFGGVDDDLLGEPAGAGAGGDPVADGPVGDVGADGGDRAGDLAARRERQRRLELVEVLDHQHVGEVDAAGVDVDDDLVRPAARVGDLLDDEVLGRSVGVEDGGAHRAQSTRSATRRRQPEPAVGLSVSELVDRRDRRAPAVHALLDALVERPRARAPGRSASGRPAMRSHGARWWSVRSNISSAATS